MSWVRAGMLFIAVALAHAASPRQPVAGTVPADGNLEEIAKARDEVQRSTAALGPEHPLTAVLLRNLALAMQEGGYANYAEQYGNQSLTILERHFGPNDVSLVPVLNVLTEAAVSQGRYDDARALALRAVAIGPGAEAHFGTALHNLAAVYQAEGNLQEAAGLYRRALAVREKMLPAGHPYIGLTRAALDRVQRLMKVSARR